MAHYSFDDLGFDPRELSGEQLAEKLDTRVADILAEIEGSPVWCTIMDSATPVILKMCILKEVYLEIAMYQPDAVEAAIAAIAQMPRSLPVRYFEEMLGHQIEEFDHGEMAVRDFVGLQGSEDYARSRAQSPSAFAVSAIWRNIAFKRAPFTYLGAVYLFDALTPVVTARVLSALGEKGAQPGMEFIAHHATADIAHAESLRALIVDVADHFPATRQDIAYGMAYFAHVYPLPCWTAAYRRAQARCETPAVAAE